MKRLDIYHDKEGVSGWKNSYWIVFKVDGSLLGRLGAFNMRCPMYFKDLMEYVGNCGEKKELADLWKDNPPVPVCIP